MPLKLNQRELKVPGRVKSPPPPLPESYRANYMFNIVHGSASNYLKIPVTINRDCVYGRV